ncbi:MAG TPA: LysR family transcriptional regulator [Syntrophaceticus sp.]|mgnify:CR=1 FL=1|jgi:molybdate transport system regulatory protein|nr:LysR family transcriptional regulator [Syntrophaceticus schinkii]MDD4261958.1 LysR family transcriptional regulator [Syntrophaceticus schinkii]MDD4675155.1 LysR family transcriptional regulator [Syntrophaceticus schinkii]HHY30335.1 LysR family transcriptional regulator [Syntrophaceticus sp.]
MKNDQRFFKLKYKIWLESTGKAFGKGPCEILNRVERLGSLKGATEEMSMSYSHAWKLIKGLEQRLGFKLLQFQVGGEAGGGASLTPEARELIKRYQSFMREAEELLDELYEKHFNDFFS